MATFNPNAVGVTDFKTVHPELQDAIDWARSGQADDKFQDMARSICKWGSGSEKQFWALIYAHKRYEVESGAAAVADVDITKLGC